MTFRLPRLANNDKVVDTASGHALKYFSRLWDQAMTKIEGQFLVSGTGIVVAAGNQTAMLRTLVAGTGLNVVNGDGQAGNPTYSLANTVVTPGSYGDATHASALTVDQQGRITACAATAIAFPVTTVFGRSGAVVAAANDYSFAQLSGSVAAGQLPNPSATTLGGVKSLAAVATKYLTQIGTDGTPAQAQPSTADLSDYVSQGSWTPADASGASLAFSGVSAQYTRIGNLVFAYADFNYPATASGLNSSISGLPFTAANANYANQGNLSYSSVAAFAAVAPNSKTFQLFNATGSRVTNATLTGSEVNVMLIYPIA